MAVCILMLKTTTKDTLDLVDWRALNGKTTLLVEQFTQSSMHQCIGVQCHHVEVVLPILVIHLFHGARILLVQHAEILHGMVDRESGLNGVDKRRLNRSNCRLPRANQLPRLASSVMAPLHALLQITRVEQVPGLIAVGPCSIG